MAYTFDCPDCDHVSEHGSRVTAAWRVFWHALLQHGRRMADAGDPRTDDDGWRFDESDRGDHT